MTIGILGTTLAVFIGVTVGLVGFAAFMAGQALANAWRPAWQLVPYGLLLGAADRFLVWGLFHGDALLVTGYLIDTAVILAIAAASFRLTLARRMTSQYPWLYERTGPFSWRAREGSK
jgi:hypothetical protein